MGLPRTLHRETQQQEASVYGESKKGRGELFVNWTSGEEIGLAALYVLRCGRMLNSQGLGSESKEGQSRIE